jgi:DNA-binding CsgD family transcriptional regulator
VDRTRAFGDQLDSLLAISAEIAALRDLTEVQDRALGYCLELTDSKFGFVGLLGDSADQMVVAAIKGFSPSVPGFVERYRFMSVRMSVFGIGLLENRPYVSNDVAHDPLSVGQPSGHPPVERFLGVPLRVGGTLIGMVGVANKTDGYGSDDERLLSTFANHVAIAIDNARLYAQQREMITRLVPIGYAPTPTGTSGSANRSAPAPVEAPSTPSSRRPADARNGRHEPLTSGQREILTLVIEGYSNREIAGRVHLSENTVKSHLQQIFRTLGVRNRVEAAMRATRDGLA